jgi:hypothetical protein
MDGERLIFSRQSAVSPLPRRTLWRSGPLARYPPQDTDATQCDMAGGRGGAPRLDLARLAHGHRGLAGALAVALDSSLSLVDARRPRKRSSMAMPKDLSSRLPAPRLERRRSVPSRRQRNVCSTLTWQRCWPNLSPSAPIFYTRGGLPGPKGGQPRPSAPYTKDTHVRG